MSSPGRTTTTPYLPGGATNRRLGDRRNDAAGDDPSVDASAETSEAGDRFRLALDANRVTRSGD